MTNKELKDTILNSVGNRLSRYGFENKRNGFYIKKIDNAVINVGLIAATHQAKGLVIIDPTIGIRHIEVENIVDIVRSEKSDWRMRTIGENVGYYLPSVNDYLSYYFYDGEDDHEKMIHDIVDKCVKASGVVVKFSNLDILLKEMQTGRGIVQNLYYRIPIILLKQHKESEAEEYMLQVIKNSKPPVDKILTQYYNDLKKYIRNYAIE